MRYGGFTACNINAVTKSGSNEFSGSVWYDTTSDSLTGDSLEGEDVAVGDYDKDRYGFTLGGPILQDQLFFFVTYEKQEGVDLQEKGPLGSGAISEVAVTQAEIDEIAQISRDIYQYDPGFIPSAFDNEDEKITAKLDWYINDDTDCLSFTTTTMDLPWFAKVEVTRADLVSQTIAMSAVLN